jgi:hypothetical protein
MYMRSGLRYFSDCIEHDCLNSVAFSPCFLETICITGAERHNRESREEAIQSGDGPAAVILTLIFRVNVFAGSTPLLAAASGKAGKGRESQKTCLNETGYRY